MFLGNFDCFGTSIATCILSQGVVRSQSPTWFCLFDAQEENARECYVTQGLGDFDGAPNALVKALDLTWAAATIVPTILDWVDLGDICYFSWRQVYIDTIILAFGVCVSPKFADASFLESSACHRHKNISNLLMP